MRGWRRSIIRILFRCSNAIVGPLMAPGLLVVVWRILMGLWRRSLGRWRRRSYVLAEAPHGVAREGAQLVLREPAE